MKTFLLLPLILLLCRCSTPSQESANDVKQFYLAWMTALTAESDTSHNTTELMQRYVAKEVIDRLTLIDSFHEQEIVDSDYFMYAQDYAPEWIPQLQVGQARPFLGGEKVDVQLGGPGDQPTIRLEVYTRREGKRWKIYRVRDVGNHFEHPIYSAGAIARARTWSAEIASEYEPLKK